MKLLLDFLPIVLFFATFKWAGGNPEQTTALLGHILNPLGIEQVVLSQAPILAATVVAIFATVLQIVVQKASGKKVENMQWVGLGLIVVFGGATLFLQDETFIKWKPTILYWAMGIAFVVAKALGKNPLEAMMKGQLQLPAAVWNKLAWAWVAFFGVMGAVNLVVAKHFSTDVWVDFKLFGTLGATLVFIVLQGFYMSKHMSNSTENNTIANQ